MHLRLLGEHGPIRHVNTITRFLTGNKPLGLKIIVVAAGIALLSLLPLLLYILFGPSDGNPIGLGLLALAGMLLGLAGLVIGIIGLLLSLRH